MENSFPLPVPRRQTAPRLLLSAREFGAYPMKAFVRITDRDWFDLLSHRPPVNLELPHTSSARRTNPYPNHHYPGSNQTYNA